MLDLSASLLLDIPFRSVHGKVDFLLRAILDLYICTVYLHQQRVFTTAKSTLKMSEVPAHETTAVDPAAINPTTTASEAMSDPIRPTATDTLAPESRPEIISTDASETKVDAVTALPTTEPAAETTAPVETQPMTDSVLGYKAPGLLK